MMPERPCGSTAIVIISQRVAPSASAASSLSRGVCRKISRQSAVMIGSTMTASTIDAVRIVRPVPDAGGVNSGIQPRFCASHEYAGCRKGASTVMPHRP